MWDSYWDDPWVLAQWPLLRRRRLSGLDVRVGTTGDGVIVRVPEEGTTSVLLAGDEAAALLAEGARGSDRVLVLGDVGPAVRAELSSLGFEERRTWDWYSVSEEREPTDQAVELIDDPTEVQALLTDSYPLADRRTSTNGRWWGVHSDGTLVAAGAADTWRGHAPDGSVDWNSHLRSFTVRRDHRGEGVGLAVFSQILFEEWRRTGWVQWSTWGDSEETAGLMRSIGVEPSTHVTNFRPVGLASPAGGYPGTETA